MSETTTTRKLTEIFETVECGRCLGSGRYSYCSMYGDRCFGCNGVGVKFTKRGQAALGFYTALLSKPLADVKVGDVVKLDDRKFRRIVEIAPDTLNAGRTIFRAEGFAFHTTVGEQMVRVAATADEKAAAIEKALAYQETLTKAGKPRKGAKTTA